MNLLQLKERRANVWSQMTSILDTAEAENRDLTAEERSTYDKAEADLDSLSADIERVERHANRGDFTETANDPGTPQLVDDNTPSTDEQYREAFINFVRGGMDALEPEQRGMLRKGWVSDKEGRAQSVGTTTAGGYLVPEGFRARIVETMKAYGRVENEAEVITTSTGATLPWPTNDDTANVGALLAENTQVTEQDVVLGQADLGAFKYTSKLVRVSLEFLQDVDWMDAEAWLARKFAERIGRIRNQHYTTGTGTSQPTGIVTGAVSGVTAASATAVTFDELIDLEHSVDPAYRESDNTAYMLSDSALKGVRKLKDGNNAYLWQPSVQAGVPSLLNGHRYVINNDMAAPAVSVKSVLFGDFRAGYIVRNVRAIQMIRMNERYADYFQVGFVSFARSDAAPQDTAAYKALTQAAA